MGGGTNDSADLNNPAIASLFSTIKRSVYQPPRSTDILLQEFIARGPNDADVATVYESIALSRWQQAGNNQGKPYQIYYLDPTIETVATAAIVRQDVDGATANAARKFISFLSESEQQKVFVQYAVDMKVQGSSISRFNHLTKTPNRIRKSGSPNFIKRFSPIISAALLLTIAAPTVAADLNLGTTRPKVILISLDGATPWLLDQYLSSGVISSNQGLGLLKSQGIVAQQNVTCTPSLTAACHIAIGTGSTAARNDINSNSFHLVASPFTPKHQWLWGTHRWL